MSYSRSIFTKAKTGFKLHTDYSPAGDQPTAIHDLVQGINAGKQDQVLLGVTGSGKTFTMANIIQATQRPAVIMAHNKTLAAQLYAEFRDFFPENAVEYFVSYYDYYQPEAYIAKTDTFIEKDSAINEQIDLLRHSATRSLIERADTIIISSVSAIYGLGSPEFYKQMRLQFEVGQNFAREYIVDQLVRLQYKRNDMDFARGSFRVNGDIIDIFPAYCEDYALRLEFFGDEIEAIHEIDALTGQKVESATQVTLYANSHHATPIETVRGIIPTILEDLKIQVDYMEKIGKPVEAQRLNQRTRYDMEMMLELGSCKGIENYSRYLDGRQIGDPPTTLFHYLPENALLFVDESHVSTPQIRAMYAGDRSRKNMLVEHGFRMTSAFDNRPLKFEEWDEKRPQTVFVSATPAPFELERAGSVVEQIIRPTGLLDPECEVRPAGEQVLDVINEIHKNTAAGMRTIIIALTKKMSEHLNEYLGELGIKCKYIHADVETIDRIQILQALRSGDIDVIIGINLLREGIDIPECGLVAIMDADKEGFLRSEMALVQIIGRAARNSAGRVILYADKITNSMKKAMDETARRRKLQIAHNTANGITPTTINKAITGVFDEIFGKENAKMKNFDKDIENMLPKELEEMIKIAKKEMKKAVHNFDFEKATEMRDKIKVMSLKMAGLIE